MVRCSASPECGNAAGLHFAVYRRGAGDRYPGGDAGAYPATGCAHDAVCVGSEHSAFRFHVSHRIDADRHAVVYAGASHALLPGDRPGHHDERSGVI